jgi:hypothetical protein
MQRSSHSREFSDFGLVLLTTLAALAHATQHRVFPKSVCRRQNGTVRKEEGRLTNGIIPRNAIRSMPYCFAPLSYECIFTRLLRCFNIVINLIFYLHASQVHVEYSIESQPDGDSCRLFQNFQIVEEVNNKSTFKQFHSVISCRLRCSFSQ